MSAGVLNGRCNGGGAYGYGGVEEGWTVINGKDTCKFMGGVMAVVEWWSGRKWQKVSGSSGSGLKKRRGNVAGAWQKTTRWEY